MKKKKKIETLWQEEKRACLALPEEDYPIFKEKIVRANKLNEIKLDNTLIHIHNSWRHGNLYAYLTWNKYRIVTQMLTSSRNPQFLLISFPQKLLDKIRLLF